MSSCQVLVVSQWSTIVELGKLGQMSAKAYKGSQSAGTARERPCRTGYGLGKRPSWHLCAQKHP
eukprot:2727340-Rhodomonas_salina.1